MDRIQFLPEPEIKALMTRDGTITRIMEGELVRVEKHQRPAKISPGGASIIYDYYDQRGRYVATAHKLIAVPEEVFHCDVKRFISGDTDYRIPVV